MDQERRENMNQFRRPQQPSRIHRPQDETIGKGDPPTVKTREEIQAEVDKSLRKQIQARAMSRMSILLNDPKETFGDCKIISSDGEEFLVHKNILMAQSPVFRTMLTCGLEESKTGVIKMKDHSSKVVKFLLHFLYTCKVLPFPLNDTTDSAEEDREKLCISELVDVATKYQVVDLVDYFDHMLGGYLCTEENALFLLKVVNKFPLPKAQVRLREFIMRNPQLNHDILSQC